MIKNIIEILEENRKFVLSRLKKYTVFEYKEELKIRNEKVIQITIYRVDEKSILLCYNINVKKGVDPNERE